jgi:hypothetical protein
VHPVDVPFTVALKMFWKWGTRAGEFVRPCKRRSHPGPRPGGPDRPLVIYSRAAEFREIWYGPEGLAEFS